MMTSQEVDKIAGSDLYMRHLLFIRYVLGEPLRDAWQMAFRAAKAGWELSIEQMEHVAAGWEEDD